MITTAAYVSKRDQIERIIESATANAISRASSENERHFINMVHGCGMHLLVIDESLTAGEIDSMGAYRLISHVMDSLNTLGERVIPNHYLEGNRLIMDVNNAIGILIKNILTK